MSPFHQIEIGNKNSSCLPNILRIYLVSGGSGPDQILAVAMRRPKQPPKIIQKLAIKINSQYACERRPSNLSHHPNMKPSI